MDLVLAGLQWSHCLVYLDDVIVLGRTFDEHLSNLESVFRRLREAGLCLKPSKCSLFRHKVQYLGHVISREGIAADPTKIEKVATWIAPHSKREIQKFLGFASYYRRFIKDFAQIAKPLHAPADRGHSNLRVDRAVSSRFRGTPTPVDFRPCPGVSRLQPPIHTGYGCQ